MSSLDAPIIPEPPTYPPDPTPPVTLVLTILLLVMFFVGFFSIYFCRCFMDNLVNSLNNRQTPNGTPINPAPAPLGLDHEIVSSFPLSSFAKLKEYHNEDYALECAICLCEYVDSDNLRLLPTCDHVFHQECVDLWFESHKSCPVCRRLPQLKTDEELPGTQHETADAPTTNVANDNDQGDHIGGDYIIEVGDDIDQQQQELERVDQGPSTTSSVAKRRVSPYINEKFSRSHSTGHSIFKDTEEGINDAKYTLRLPQHIREKITRKHMVALSCTTFGDFTSKVNKTHEVFGEISNSSSTLGDMNKHVNRV